jgi:hypothetical protein
MESVSELFYFIFELFNKASKYSDCIAFNGRTSNEYGIGKKWKEAVVP